MARGGLLLARFWMALCLGCGGLSGNGQNSRGRFGLCNQHARHCWAPAQGQHSPGGV